MSDKLVTIMLVEDDEIDIKNVQRAFSKNNIANPLLVAHDGVEGLDMLRGTNGHAKVNPLPRIILLDINMPKMNGIEFLKELRADNELKAISVFVMTTSNDEKDKINAYNYNVAGYILKPVNFEIFLNAISILDTYWKLCELPD
ncbi:MAG: response regulator [Bacteroidia bacterium]|nr:response regulator [Bacteroidia bacterium]